MLQNASYMFFLKQKQNKTKQNDYEKKKKVSRSRSRTQDLRRVMVTQYPLCNATIAKSIRQIIVFNIFVPGEINYSRWRRKCRRTTKWVPQKVTFEYHRNPKILCCLAQ